MYLRCAILLLTVQVCLVIVTKLPSKCKTRIYKGDDVKPNSFPYQIALYTTHSDDLQTFCGGSLITTKFVLTAGHCLTDVKSIIVLVAAHSLRDPEQHKIVITTQLYKLHNKFNPSTMNNDIGLVELPKPVTLSKLIGTIKLPKKSDTKMKTVGKYGTLTGWGFTSDDSVRTNNYLKKLRVHLIDDRSCFGFTITSNNLCGVGDLNGSACVGDSGNPLVLENTNTQIGIMSYGADDGCTLGFPHIYTNVMSYLSWIQKNSDYKIEP